MPRFKFNFIIQFSKVEYVSSSSKHTFKPVRALAFRKYPLAHVGDNSVAISASSNALNLQKSNFLPYHGQLGYFFQNLTLVN